MNNYLMIGALAIIIFLVLAASLPNQVYKSSDKSFAAVTIIFCILTLGVLVMFTKI